MICVFVIFVFVVLVVFFVWVIDIQQVIFLGGIKVWLVEDYLIFFIVLFLMFKGGVSFDVLEKCGVINLMIVLFEEGVGEMNLVQFVEVVEGLGVLVWFNVGDDVLIVIVWVLIDNCDQVVDLLCVVLIEFCFDFDVVECVCVQVQLVIKFEVIDL